MSSCTHASTAASSAVKAPIHATISSTSGVSANSHDVRCSRYTPAVTIVAAWISAETGVGPFHRVRQPDVQRELRRLAHGAEVDAERDERQAGERQLAAGDHHAQLAEVERARQPPEHDDADEQADVAGFRRPERLDRRARGFGLLIPEADQQVRAEPDQLPADEELQQVGREHQPHHREREERLVGVVAPRPGGGSSLRYASEYTWTRKRDQRDEHEHHRGRLVGEHADRGERRPCAGSQSHDQARSARRRSRASQ